MATKHRPSAIVGALLRALCDAAPEVDKPGAREKFSAVVAWLKSAATRAGNEELLDDIADTVHDLGLTENNVDGAVGSGASKELSDHPQQSLVSAAEKALVVLAIANFVAGLDCDVAAVLVQATSG